jgi:hypothetical protein
MAAICIAAIFFLCSALCAAQKDSLFVPGEELTYNVSYASVDIGQIRVHVDSLLRRNDSVFYRATAYIDSYKKIPFVDLHALFQSEFTAQGYSVWFDSRTKESNDRWSEMVYRFAYPDKKLLMTRGVWKSPSVVRRDTLTLDTLSQDGLSMFFTVRKLLRSDRTTALPTVVNEKKGLTRVFFPGTRESETIEAVDYPVDLVHFRGQADFVGVFGLTGDFEGWFSNDGGAVPVLAKMKVVIGTIRVELVRWKRPGWAPPRAPEPQGK